MTSNLKNWAKYTKEWRDPAQIIGQWGGGAECDHRLLSHRVKGNWWGIVQKLHIRLLVSREYEHLVLSLGAKKGKGEISYLCIPHPSGIAVNQRKKRIYISSTRNPNQVHEFVPASGLIKRGDIAKSSRTLKENKNTLVPRRTFTYPGSLYIHDITLIGSKLYANAVGHNAIVELKETGGYKYVWHPACIDSTKGPRFELNYLQMNSIAAGKTVRDSFFSASTDQVTKLRPGHVNFPVDQRGVIFSGKSRKPICDGLTRPHSARLYKGKIYVGNSGYGELGYVDGKKFRSVVKLPGWTRGLCIKDGIAFVGTSRVIPKFYRYAPGLDVKKSICGVHAVELKSGKVLGSIEWPNGNQIFSVESISKDLSKGFYQDYLPKRKSKDITDFYYAFKTTD